MSKMIEQSVKEKLKNISKKNDIPFNSLLETLFLERFIMRITKSPYKENLIFKGGMCLAQYFNIGRETLDLDFLMQKIESRKEDVRFVFDKIAAIEINDGVEFEVIELNTLSIEHKKYPGFRLSILGKLGQIKQYINIDLGVGDIVKTNLIEMEFLNDKGPLFEKSTNLLAYPPEYIFAEKLEAIIYLDETNSRMKDFFDCFQIIQEKSISKDNFKEAIETTFLNRGTKLNPIPDFSGPLAVRWNNFIRKNKIKDLKLDFVIGEINNFLKDIGID